MAYLTDESGNRFLENGSLLVDSVPLTRLGYGGYGVRRAGIFGGKGSTAHPEVKITKLSLDGYGVKRSGSFASKASGDGPHTVGVITRLGLDGYGVRRYGSFAGKTSGAHPVGIITRLGLDGYGLRRYRSFAGKPPSIIVVPPVDIPPAGTGGWGARLNASVQPLSSRKRKRHDEEEDRRRRSLEALEAAINAAFESIEVDAPVELPPAPQIDWAVIEDDRQAYLDTKNRLERQLAGLKAYELELRAYKLRLQIEEDDEILMLM